MPGTAPNSSHHVGVPSCPAWNSNHVSRLSMEDSVKQPPSSFMGSLSFGSQKLTLLPGRGSSGDWGCTPHKSPWEWLWLLALAQFWDQPPEWVLDWFLEWVLDWLLLWLWEWAHYLLLHSLPSLLRSLWRALVVSNALWWTTQRATS